MKTPKEARLFQQKEKPELPCILIMTSLMIFAYERKKQGMGYQTMINEALREYLAKSGKPLDETVIRQVIREELDRVAHH